MWERALVKGFFIHFLLSILASAIFFSFFLKIFFWCGTSFLKVFIEFVMIMLLFYVFFCPEACGVLASQPGIEPASLELESKVPTTGPPRKTPIVRK